MDVFSRQVDVPDISIEAVDHIAVIVAQGGGKLSVATAEVDYKTTFDTGCTQNLGGVLLLRLVLSHQGDTQYCQETDSCKKSIFHFYPQQKKQNKMKIRAYSFQSANQGKKNKSSGKGTYLKMTTLRNGIGFQTFAIRRKCTGNLSL